MASQILNQALFAVPKNPNQCSPIKLGFSAVVSCCPSTLASRSLPLVSKASSTSILWNCSPLTAQPFKSNFVVRAESNSEGGGEASDNVEEAESAGVEEVSEAEAEVSDSDLKVEEPKPPRKPRVKLGDIMGILNQRAIEASDKERPTPDLRTGDIVEIKLEVPENRRRLSVYKGIVISKQNAGIHTTIRIRRIIAGVGVEIVFPVYSPNIKEIRVVNHRKVRRARLYYLRDKLPRLSTFK
ncbi:50S ribosomal protein L19, chloroplastic-like isoform X2 [Senna tora]|uniref:50S ribosomal protein L19, chloroplastic-like isoform X2 n=1 Tax=Senna tora TaxID=362788 RepID=A0A834TUR8_9FABA|nr:50S ribosomal protein L19, chloroplastic-like isoform X2 [Senna tora]